MKIVTLLSSKLPGFLKHRAGWFELNRRTVAQCFVGALSQIRRANTLVPDEVRTYFRKQYLSPFDDLIFDGKFQRYHAQLESDVSSLEGLNIVDFGCGEGALHIYLKSQSVDFKTYLGIDFASEAKELASNARILNSDAVSGFEKAKFEGRVAAVFSNSACYMCDSTVEEIARDTRISKALILEPFPGFFWDRSFGGISPRYRYPEQVMRLMEASGYSVVVGRLHYALSKRFPIWPICYNILFERA